MIRVAAIMGKMSSGGKKSLVMEYYRHINREEIQFDFLCDADSNSIPFDEIELIKYNYGFLKPFKYTIFSTVFYFVLKNGERIRFFTFFEGSENVLKQKLSEMNFDVKKCKFKNL